jgi:dolichol-phosphate mannosyltransferase
VAGAAALALAVAGIVSPPVAALFFLGAVQLVALWVLGQYVAAIAEEVRSRPLYLIAEAINFQSSPASLVTGVR